VPAVIAITALDVTGLSLGITTLTLPRNARGAANIGPRLNLSSFTGSVQMTSTAPIVSLSLKRGSVSGVMAPGYLPDGTPLATGH
jgi:hypothetical protein